MKKTLLAGAVALAAASNASAATFDIAISEMVFGTTSAVTGTLSGADGVASGVIEGVYFEAPWSATAMAVFDGAGTYQWAEAGGIVVPGFGTFDDANNNDDVWIASFDYNFTLTDSQVAFGLSFDWSTNYDIPVLAILDCDTAGVCTGVGTPMATAPFAGQAPSWNGTVSAVPVPAAVWLFGSGLVGLAGIARRRKA